MGGGSKLENNATLWLDIVSWNLPDSQLSWESKMEPSVAKRSGDNFYGDISNVTFVLWTKVT